MSYQLYRNTTLGTSLQDSIDDMVQQGHITPQLAMKVMLQFDKTINSALATKVRNRVQFKGHLSTYRFCDNVWTLVMDHSEYRIDVNDSLKCDNVKIVACDGRGATGQHD